MSDLLRKRRKPLKIRELAVDCDQCRRQIIGDSVRVIVRKVYEFHHLHCLKTWVDNQVTASPASSEKPSAAEGTSGTTS